MECELCGKALINIRKARVEGPILTVCDECVKFGTEVQFSRPAQTIATTDIGRAEQKRDAAYVHKATPAYAQGVEEIEFVEDYHKIMQKAFNEWQPADKEQEKSLDLFANFLNERKSVISGLMNKTMPLDEKLAKKLEKTLGVKLRAEKEE